jgi:integrase
VICKNDEPKPALANRVYREVIRRSSEHDQVPLSNSAIAIIKSMPADSTYIFRGGKKDAPLSNMAMLKTLERMGMREQVVTHGFRSTFRDWAAETGDYPNELLEMAIAHLIDNKVEAVYRRGDLHKKRHKLMADWERFCTQAARRR